MALLLRCGRLFLEQSKNLAVHRGVKGELLSWPPVESNTTKRQRQWVLAHIRAALEWVFVLLDDQNKPRRGQAGHLDDCLMIVIVKVKILKVSAYEPMNHPRLTTTADWTG